MDISTERQMSFWAKFFRDDDGNPSSMRVLSSIAFIASVYLALFVVLYQGQESPSTVLIFYFLAAAFAPKLIQKFAEGGKLDIDSEDDFESKKGWFTDKNGNPSSIRFMALGALVVAIALALIETHGWGTKQEKTELVLYFLVAAFAPKALQKFGEK